MNMDRIRTRIGYEYGQRTCSNDAFFAHSLDGHIEVRLAAGHQELRGGA
jgi:hypothetical protein